MLNYNISITGFSKRFAPFWSDSPEKARMLATGKEKSEGFLQTSHGSRGSIVDLAGNLDTSHIKWKFLQQEEDHRDFFLSV